MKKHSERAHSKFSASGADRWMACPGSVALSEGQPDKGSVYAEEGTQAHEVLEAMLKDLPVPEVKKEMWGYARDAADHIIGLRDRHDGALLMVEERVYLDFLHPEAFGTLDASIVELFGALHILDFKYGMSVVSPRENLQFLFYAIAVAHKYDWNFSKVRLWSLQPRVRGFNGYAFWDLSVFDLKKYVPVFKKAIERVEANPDKYVEGQWCHWCKAKAICPLKLENKNEKASMIFGAVGASTKKGDYDQEKESKEENEEEGYFDGWTYKKGQGKR